MKKIDYFKEIIIFLLIILTYFPTFIWMIDRWKAADSYYSHGFLIPFISGFIAWHNLRKLSGFRIIPVFRWGWLLLIMGTGIHVISALLRVHFTSAYSLLLVLSGLILLFGGKEYFKKMLFPILFLTFMIPLPLFLTSNLSFRLKILASQMAVAIVNMTGVKAVIDGSVIITAHSQLIVEDPCSGIRSLIALIALSFLFAYYSKITKRGKIILCFASVPIAICANVVRIVMLTLVGEIYGARFTTGLFHEIMGFGVFVLAFLGLSILLKVLK